MLALRVILPVLLVKVAISLAALDDCPETQYFNGTQCMPCTACPPGFGVKTKCTPKGDTECHACWPRHDYSNTTGFEPCIGCHTYSNGLEGQFKIVKNCTIFGPYVCDGCADGNFFDSGSGIKGACVQCRGPCSSLEDETRPCRTEHDRVCTAKRARPTTLVSGGVFPTVRGTDSPDNGGTVPTVILGLDAKGTKPTATSTPLVKKPWLWVGLAASAVTVVIIAAIVTKCRRGRNRKRGKNTPENVIQIRQMVPLMPPTGRNERGLDLPIIKLTADDRKSIALKLNGKDTYGYFYWRIIAEKLGLMEWRAWEGKQNPTEMLLTAYGEKEGSTIRGLISALREAGLTQFAYEIEQAFSTAHPE